MNEAEVKRQWRQGEISETVAIRQLMEVRIARKVLTEMQKHNITPISVNDGEETHHIDIDNKNHKQITEATLKLMFTTDEDVVNFTGGHWVYFVYGNSGWDVISDHNDSCSDIMAPIMENIVDCL